MLFRSREEDIPELAYELIARHSTAETTVSLLPETVEILRQYPWPGNIRELANLIERLVIMYPGGVIAPSDLPLPYSDPNIIEILESGEQSDDSHPIGDSGLDLKHKINKLEFGYIKSALAKANGVVAHAAELLKMRRTTLVEKMRKHGINKKIKEMADE